MDDFAALPLELVMMILRFAALSAVRDDKAWVAALPRVSRPAYSVVRPVLYESMHVTRANMVKIHAVTPSAFACTRCAAVSHAVHVKDCWPPALAELGHIRTFSSSMRNYTRLLWMFPSFRPRAVSLHPGLPIHAVLDHATARVR